MTSSSVHITRLWIRTETLTALYSTPTAKIKHLGQLFPYINIQQGTHHACPLSPFLFALAMKPLSLAIQHNPDMSGYKNVYQDFFPFT